MRYPEAHAAKSGSVPFVLRGPKSVRAVLATTVAGALGLVPAVAVATPAFAAPTPVPDVTVSNASGTEGQDLTFQVKYSGLATALPLTLTVATDADPAATAATGATGADYTAVSKTITFTSANQTIPVTVHTTDDAIYENTETFALNVTDTSSDETTAIGTIYDNDPKPSYRLTATPGTVTEPTSSGDPAHPATTPAQINAVLSTKSGVDTKIVLTTSDGSAKANKNYVPLTGTTNVITIPAGSLTSTTTVPVDVIGNGLKNVADKETFTVNGSADNAAPQDQSVPVNINDLQPTPVLSLAALGSSATSGSPASTVTETEGNSITYTVTATPGSELPINVQWNAVPVPPVSEGDDPATPGSDFTYPSNRTVTIPAGSTSATFTVSLPDDGLNENQKDFGIQLVNPMNAKVSDRGGMVTGSIIDANTTAQPDASISPLKVMKGKDGKQQQVFTVTLSRKSGRTVKVNWAAVADTTVGANAAVVGKNFIPASGTLSIPAGKLTQNFMVTTVGNNTNTGDQTFVITLASPSGDNSAVISTPNQSTTVTITDTTLPPLLSFDGPPPMKEGDGPSAILIPVKLSNPSSKSITLDVTDANSSNGGTGSEGYPDATQAGSGDYAILAQQVTIPAGATQAFVPVMINGDNVFETDETGFIQVAPHGAADAAALSDRTPNATAKIMLQNDDKPPMLAVNNTSGMPGDSVSVNGTLEGASQGDTNLTVQFKGAAVKGSIPASPDDFTDPGPTQVTIPGGTPEGTSIPIGSVDLLNNPKGKPNETIVVSGAGPNAQQVVPGTVWINPTGDTGGTTPPPSNGKPTFMAPASITGAVAVPISGKADPGATVDLWAAPWSPAKPPLAKILTTTADKNGNYSFSRWIGTGFRFQVSIGDWQSEVKTVSITQSPLLSAASTTKGSLTVAAQGNPRAAGQKVTIQSWVKGKWTTAWTGTTSSTNQFKATVKATSGTTLTLRAWVDGMPDMGVMGGYSPTKKVTIK